MWLHRRMYMHECTQTHTLTFVPYSQYAIYIYTYHIDFIHLFSHYSKYTFTHTQQLFLNICSSTPQCGQSSIKKKKSILICESSDNDYNRYNYLDFNENIINVSYLAAAFFSFCLDTHETF